MLRFGSWHRDFIRIRGITILTRVYIRISFTKFYNYILFAFCKRWIKLQYYIYTTKMYAYLKHLNTMAEKKCNPIRKQPAKLSFLIRVGLSIKTMASWHHITVKRHRALRLAALSVRFWSSSLIFIDLSIHLCWKASTMLKKCFEISREKNNEKIHRRVQFN